MDKGLKAGDCNHFWLNGVLIDLTALRYERDSLNEQQQQSDKGNWRPIHGRNTAVYMLSVYADYLTKGENLDLVTPEKVIKYLEEANRNGLHTGWKNGQ